MPPDPCRACHQRLWTSAGETLLTWPGREGVGPFANPRVFRTYWKCRVCGRVTGVTTHESTEVPRAANPLAVTAPPPGGVRAGEGDGRPGPGG